jgi:hypothetical protein
MRQARGAKTERLPPGHHDDFLGIIFGQVGTAFAVRTQRGPLIVWAPTNCAGS